MITIVLPVYNGGAYLRGCIESLARQDAGPGTFELVVLDNCSTDGALDALSLLPDSIKRRVLRSGRLLPIEQNWARILEIPALGEFITTIGHDDMLDPGFIRLMSRALADHDGGRVLFAHFRLIDEKGALIRPCRPMAPRESPAQFLAGRLAGIRDSFGTGYVVRTDEYRDAGGIPSYPSLLYADDALWMSLAKRSGIRILPDECFSYRLHAASTSQLKDPSAFLLAWVRYLDFLEPLAKSDDEIRQVLRTYGPGYFEAVATRWMAQEALRANLANVAARADIMDGCIEAHRRLLRITALNERSLQSSDELAFSLWANEGALRRRLFSKRFTRVVMRALRKAALRTARRPKALDA